MKCPMCGGIGLTDLHTPNVGRCIKCNGSGEIEPTNEEWLHSLNTEQLADAIYDLLIDRQWDSWSWKLNGMVLRDIHEHGNTKSTKAITEWLKQPHTNE